MRAAKAVVSAGGRLGSAAEPLWEETEEITAAASRRDAPEEPAQALSASRGAPAPVTPHPAAGRADPDSGAVCLVNTLLLKTITKSYRLQ